MRAPTPLVLAAAFAVAAAVVSHASAANLRERCSSASDCAGIANTNCSDSQCVCLPGYFPDYNGTLCHPGSEAYGAPCRDTAECQLILGTKSACQRRLLSNDTTERCLCLLSNHYDPTNRTCQKSLRLQDRCTGGVEGSCYLELDGDHQHVVCASNGTCACQDGYAPDYQLMRCGIYKACSVDADCAEFVNAECGGRGSCACRAGYNAVTDADTRNIYCAKGLREECGSPRDCVKNAECRDGRCSCLADYLPSFSGDRCHHKAQAYNASCEQSWECAEAMGTLGRCDASRRCVCDAAAHYHNFTCYRSLQFGSACADDELGRCYMAGDGGNQHTACASNGTCACAGGYFPTPDLMHCSGAGQPWLSVGAAGALLLVTMTVTRWASQP